MIIIRAMDPYELLWMVLLIVFVLGELATIGLTCIWFAAGAHLRHWLWQWQG